MSRQTNKTKVYGYCRISTAKQNIERQVRNILSVYPDAIIIKETYTGTKFQGRKELDKILKKVKQGDTIVFDSVSRMSRNADEGIVLYKQMFEMGVNLVFLKEHHIDTDTYKQAIEKQLQVAINSGDDATDELMNTVIDALNKYIMRLAEKQILLAFEQAQKEVDDLHQRTREGIETARRNGKQIGRTPGKTITTKKSVSAKAIIMRHSKSFGGTLNDTEIQKQSGISRNSLYKYKRELLAEIEQSTFDDVKNKYLSH